MKYYKIFFSILIFLLLIVPLFHMNMAEVSKQENRTLTKFPEIKKKGKINSDYGKEFEAWLGDRFWGRDRLIDARFQALYKINGRIENEKAFVGDDGWMFEKKNTVYRPSIKKQRKKVEYDAKILKKFADKFKGKIVSIYLVIEPDRSVLYQKYWEKHYKPLPQLDYAKEIKIYLYGYPNVHVIRNNVPEGLRIFSKIDTHLSTKGVDLMLKSILAQLKFDFPDLKKIKFHWNYQKVHSARSIAAWLLNNFPEDEDVNPRVQTKILLPNIRYRSNNIIKFPKEPHDIVLEIGENIGNVINHDLIVLGPCYASENIYPAFKYFFKRTIVGRTNADRHFMHEIAKSIKKSLHTSSSSLIILFVHDSTLSFLKNYILD